MSIFPSKERAIQILQDSGCSPNIITHCKMVSKLAINIANRFELKGYPIDFDLVEIGALLHDVGKSKIHGVKHVAEGAKIACSLNLYEPIVHIIERHIGAGIPAEEAVKLGLPKKDYVPRALEEKIVAYADKLIERGQQVTFKEALKNLIKAFGLEHPIIERFKKLHNELIVVFGE